MGMKGGCRSDSVACALHQQIRSHRAPTQTAHMQSSQSTHKHTAMEICAEFQPRPCPCMQPVLVLVLASFSWRHHTGYRKNEEFLVRFFQSIKWCCDTHWSQNASMTMFGLLVVWYTKPEGKQGHAAECISLHLHTNHCCAYLAASLELASVKHSAGKQRLQVAQGRCKSLPLSRAEKVLCV